MKVQFLPGRLSVTTLEDGTMRVICAWCTLHLSGEENAEVISHGICPGCAERFLEEEGLEIEVIDETLVEEW
jgi:hypothetical protein